MKDINANKYNTILKEKEEDSFEKKYAKELLNDNLLNLWWDIDNLDLNSSEVQKLLVKYRYLLLNYIYFDKNKFDFSSKVAEEDCKKRATFTKEQIIWILEPEQKQKFEQSLSVINKKKINKKILSLPLFMMWDFINENLDYLNEWNHRQIEFAEHFWIKDLEQLKTIVEILWFNDDLNWQTINLRVDDYKQLYTDLKSMEDSWELWKIWGNGLLLSIAVNMKTHDYKELYHAANSLWYKEKLWISSITLNTTDILHLLKFVWHNFGRPNTEDEKPNQKTHNFVLTESNIDTILKQNLHLFTKYKISEIKQSFIVDKKSKIRSLLRWFWYNLEIDKWPERMSQEKRNRLKRIK